MTSEPHVVYRGFGPSEALSRQISEELAALGRLSSRIVSSRVVLELPHRHKRHGKHFLVKIELSLPGKVLTIDRDPPAHDNFEDPWAALHETFAKARRVLLEHLQVRRGDVKAHPRAGLHKARP